MFIAWTEKLGVRGQMLNRHQIICAWIIVLLLVDGVCANPAQLQFTIPQRSTKTLGLDDLQRKLKIHDISLYDPHYAKQKRYAAFKIYDVLQLAFGNSLEEDAYSDVAFIALDGYKAIGQIDKLKEDGGFLAFSDLDVKAWEPVGRKKAMPGPFYLVWTGELQTTAYGYPWPWQVASIQLIRFADQYPAVYPLGVKSASSVFKGFQIFKYRCFRCHAMNQQGGTIGPDLQAPKSIVEYRTREMIKEFIKQPSKYRYTQMPDHIDFSEQDLDALLDYFQYQSNAK